MGGGGGVILLVGATGNVGGYVAHRLGGRSGVRALVRSPAAAAAVAAKGIEPVAGDLARAETLAPALAGVKSVLLVTPYTPDQAELECRFLDAAAGAGVEHVVKVAAREAAAGVEVAMTSSHRTVESHLAALGVDHVNLVCDWFTSNYDEQVELLRGGVLAFPHPEAPTATVDVRDVADAAVACLEDRSVAEGRRTVLVTGPETLTFRQLGERIAAGLPRPLELVEASIEDWEGGLVMFGVPE
ncbi:MAG TPA: NmrA family NAD(P)-binding protein, partial [Solirubrobacterales bacterium]